MKEKPSVRSIVRLPSGGPMMTVCAVRDDYLVQVAYITTEREILRKEWLDYRCLVLENQ
mgnify:FL=1